MVTKKEISFAVRGNPKAQKRHRHTNRGITYDPSKSDKADFLVLSHTHAPPEPIKAPITLDLSFFMPIPKSTSKKMKKAMESETFPHTKTPDVDNLYKLLDCLNGVFWQDDKLIYNVRMQKFYSPVPRTEVRVSW